MQYRSSGIPGLDLDPIIVKIMDASDGEGWTLAKAEQVCEAYRQFLFLTLKYPDVRIAPAKEVDVFWHYHILDTMKYAEDCQEVFGHFLHHFPYFGMRSEEDRQNLNAAGARGRELLRLEFGSDAKFVAQEGVNNCSHCESEPEPSGCVSSCDAPQCNPAHTIGARFERPKLIRVAHAQ